MKMYDDQLIVVTGGAGFIGSGVIRYLNNCNKNNIIIVDDLGSTQKWKNLVGKKFLDIISIKDFFSWLQGHESVIEAFIHLGACTDTTETDATYLTENNFRFSQRLVDYALTNEHRFIYASSAATYGDGTQGFTDDHETLESLCPQNMYGYSKHLFDLWLKDQGLLNKVVGLKYFNVFGPNEGHKGRMASAIIKLLADAQTKDEIKLFKSNDPDHFPDGGQQRDFIYIKDVARMTCAFLENEACGLFNIGTGHANTWNAMAQAVFKAINKPSKIGYIDIPKDIIGYQNYTCADMKKSRAVLKELADCASFESSVIDYICSHLLVQKNW